MKLYAYRTLGGGWTACATWGRTMLWADGPTWASATREAMKWTYCVEILGRPWPSPTANVTRANTPSTHEED